MNDFEITMKNVFRHALFCMASCLLAWAFIPASKPYAAGFVLGVLISLVNARILYAQINAITEAALQNKGKRVNLGFISRICMVLIGTMICLKFPQFHLAAAVAGFFFVPAATFITGIYSILQNKISHEKR